MADGCDEVHRWGAVRVVSRDIKLDLEDSARIRGALWPEELGMDAADVSDRRDGEYVAGDVVFCVRSSICNSAQLHDHSSDHAFTVGQRRLQEVPVVLDASIDPRKRLLLVHLDHLMLAQIARRLNHAQLETPPRLAADRHARAPG
eukprot:scaffold33789_cov66-Phaeocystis_antarctica.AAC.2